MSNKRINRKYTDEEIRCVVADRKKGLSYRSIAKKNNAPLASLHRIIENPSGKRIAGKPPVLSLEEEGLIITAVLTAQKANQPIDSFFLKTRKVFRITRLSANSEHPDL